VIRNTFLEQTERRPRHQTKIVSGAHTGPSMGPIQGPSMGPYGARIGCTRAMSEPKYSYNAFQTTSQKSL